MYNSKTLIRSSFVSLLIVALGLFLLCVSRAPRIETNESATGNPNDEQSLMALLNEADGEMSQQSVAATEKSSANDGTQSSQDISDDELGSLLSEANDAFASNQSSGSSGDTDELMKLLQADETTQQQPFPAENANGYAQDVSPSQSQDDLNQLLGASDSENQNDGQSLAAINDEIHHLENVLNEKTSLKQQLQQQIQEYDQRIAQLESHLTSPASESNYYAGQQSTTDYGYSETSSSTNVAFNSNTPIDDYEITYKDALQLFNEHRYRDAVSQFYALLQINPRHKLADNCQYWIGECYYAQGKYYQAIAEFNKVAAFDAADKKDDAQLMLGLCFLKVGEKNAAQTEFNWLIGAFANSEYVNKAYHYLRRL